MTSAPQAVTIAVIGYGVGLSWGAAVVELDAAATLLHREHTSSFEHRSGPEVAG